MAMPWLHSGGLRAAWPFRPSSFLWRHSGYIGGHYARAGQVLDQRRSRQGGADRRRGVHRRRHAYAVARPFFPGAVLRSSDRLSGFVVAAMGAWWPLRRGRRPDDRWLVLHQAALLTSGGAYAVLPYVYQARLNTIVAHAATDHRRSGACRDHTGPLIMVVAFVVCGRMDARHFSGRDALVSQASSPRLWLRSYTFCLRSCSFFLGAPSSESTQAT